MNKNDSFNFFIFNTTLSLSVKFNFHLIPTTSYHLFNHLLTFSCDLFTGHGQPTNGPSSFGKIVGVVRNVSTDFKNTTTVTVENVKSACELIGDCVRQSGANVVNRTVTVTSESLKNGATAVDKAVTTTRDSVKFSVRSISDIISKSKCVIPKNADNILRAALLQQCVSPSLGK